MMHFRLSDIEWETDGASPTLPTQCEVECDGEDQIAATLSGLHGWLVRDFVIEDDSSLPGHAGALG
ncbi:hypothetical protein FDU21_13655 [Xanthomonas oryzae pv. oryzae]|nr:hypothetical protein FDU21_13655 [Xanthomonas oryzae pv. oryzae]